MYTDGLSRLLLETDSPCSVFLLNGVPTMASLIDRNGVCYVHAASLAKSGGSVSRPTPGSWPARSFGSSSQPNSAATAKRAFAVRAQNDQARAAIGQQRNQLQPIWELLHTVTLCTTTVERGSDLQKVFESKFDGVRIPSEPFTP